MGEPGGRTDRDGMNEDRSSGQSTRLIHAGRTPMRFKGAVNPPIQRASTLLTPDVDALYGGSKSLYGRLGTEVHDVLCEGLQTPENARHAQLAPNGLSACSLSIGALVEAGDHVVITDSAYGPTRRFCERYLRRMGVEVSFFNPRDDKQAFSEHIKDNTKLVFMESPGSLTFEVHKISEIVELCKARSIITIMDNTWAAGVFLKPLDIGCDLSVQALTKYVIGHSDGFGGVVMTNDDSLAEKVLFCAQDWGLSMSPDDAYLAQRGLRTLDHRIRAQGHSGLEIARWLEKHPAISLVCHPGLESHPDHEIWTLLYTGCSGLFGFTLKSTDESELRHFFAELTLFGFGFSWGGFESLMIPCDPQLKRTRSRDWLNRKQGSLVRISTGLENTEDLIQDLDRALSMFA